jgi:hypothetical protein
MMMGNPIAAGGSEICEERGVTYCLGYCEGCTETEEFEGNEDVYTFDFARFESVFWRDGRFIAEQPRNLHGNSVPLESLELPLTLSQYWRYAHDEEESREDTLRNQAEDMEKRGRHGNKDQQPLGQIREALFNHTFNVRLLLILLIWIGADSDDAEGGCVERRLWNETVRKWNTKKTRNSSHQTQ